MELIDIFGRINQLRDNLADLERLRHHMDEWGWIDMSWEEFSSLSDEQKDYLGEQSFM